MRPRYESEGDRRLELEVIETVAGLAKLSPWKLPPLAHADFALNRGGRTVALAEVKVRRRHFEPLFLSLEKVLELQRYAAAGIKCRVLFATPAGIFSKAIEPGSVGGWIAPGGRSDRGDRSDRELMVHFGDLVVDGRVVERHDRPARVCDSRPEWFSSEGVPA